MRCGSIRRLFTVDFQRKVVEYVFDIKTKGKRFRNSTAAVAKQLSQVLGRQLIDLCKAQYGKLFKGDGQSRYVSTLKYLALKERIVEYIHLRNRQYQRTNVVYRRSC
jgi:hypothetical protein